MRHPPLRTFGVLCAGALAVAAGAAAPQAPAFDAGRAYAHLRQLVAIGPRPSGSPAIARARAYISGQLEAVGLRVSEHAFEADTPAGPIPMVNLSVSLPGAQRGRLVIGGHYDTKRFRQFRFVGANDGGSSAAFLIELARVLGERDNPLTIDIVFFDGEEAVVDWRGTDHTYGSREYVAEARRDGRLPDIRAMLLVDMIGDRQLQIRRDDNSTPWLTGMIWASARRLGHDSAFLDASLRVEDDHLPFLAAGIPAVDIIDLEYPAWHTPADTLDQVGARSLQTVADVLLEALPAVEARLLER